MSSMRLAFPAVIFATTASVAMPAYAYLDPGTGSMLLQLLLGGFAGLAVVGKLYWQKLKGLVRRAPAPPDGEAKP